MKRGDSCNWVGNDCSKILAFLAFLAFLTFFFFTCERKTKRVGQKVETQKQTQYQKTGIVISCRGTNRRWVKRAWVVVP